MKKLKIYTVALLSFFVFSTLIAAVNADSILGNWEDRDPVQGTSIINIYKEGNLYFGKLIKIQNPSQLDVENPDKAKRNNKVQGMVILQKLKFDGKQLWDGGTIYDPKTGKTYSCKVWLENDKILKMRGFIGFSLIGETHEWYRGDDKAKPIEPAVKSQLGLEQILFR